MKLKSILSLLVLALSFGSLAETTGNELSDSMTADRFTSSYSGSKTISNGRYIGGGIAAIIPGWGIGHAVQGRWMEKGWMFTAGNLVITGGLIFSGVSLFSDAAEKGGEESLKTWGGLTLALYLAAIGLKLWEVADAWMLPSNYTIVKESPFQIKPLAFYDQENLNLGLSLNYTF